MFVPGCQTNLFIDDPPTQPQIVNVATVPLRSPFRYPGGKTWLVPEVIRWLKSKRSVPSEFVELFAGGGIVGLTVAFEQLATHVVMVEIDPDVASVWKTILSDDAEWLAKKILSFEITLANVQRALFASPKSTRHRAFQTLLRNRVNHGGILAPGSGVLKYGENGKGVASRWYPQTLAKRIRCIYNVRKKITFSEGDAFKVLRTFSKRKDVTYFIDPPYTAPGKRAGRRLYAYNEIDHRLLFSELSRVKGDFMLTYDDTESIRQMAARHKFKINEVPMKNTHHAKMVELLISS
jgi:DNA adenine methylase